MGRFSTPGGASRRDVTRESEVALLADVSGGDGIGGAGGKVKRMVGCLRAVKGCGKGNGLIMNCETPDEDVRSREVASVRGGDEVGLAITGQSHDG